MNPASFWSWDRALLSKCHIPMKGWEKTLHIGDSYIILNHTARMEFSCLSMEVIMTTNLSISLMLELKDGWMNDFHTNKIYCMSPQAFARNIPIVSHC
jgi:hypothetical protein